MTIDRCLKGGGTYHLKDLMKVCSEAATEYENRKRGDYTDVERKVSRRTILYDLDFMKDPEFGFGAPICSDKVEGYYYDDPRFEIFRAKIAPSDLEELNQSLLILKRISGGGEFQELASVITRIEETYDIRRSQNTRPIVYFENSTNIDGQKWINTLKKSIQKEETISIDYEPFGRATYVRTVSPYIIKEYNNRWFLIGYDHEATAISTIALDRIKDLRLSLRTLHREPTFHPDDYLKDIVGISVNQENAKCRVLFKAYGNQGHYIKTKPLHPSQSITEMSDNHAIFCIEVIPNFELESKLLGYGEQVEVLEPEWLREKFAGRVRSMVERYG